MQPCLNEMDEITHEKAIIKSESRCQAVTLLVHDLTFDGVMTGSLSHSQSVLSSASRVPSLSFFSSGFASDETLFASVSENFMDPLKPLIQIIAKSMPINAIRSGVNTTESLILIYALRKAAVSPK